MRTMARALLRKIRPIRELQPRWRDVPLEFRVACAVLWSAKTKSDPGTAILTPQSLAVGIHGEDRRVWASLQRDGSSERDAVCFEAEASESVRPEFPVPNLSEAVTGCNELSIVS